MVQMPPGVPVATVAINGARNAAILAAKILRVAGLAAPAGTAGAAAAGLAGVAHLKSGAAPPLSAGAEGGAI